MDRTTEPVIAVLGHPIAGNAAQFALERAFAAMQLDWRVLSFDVSPEQLHTALSGLDVLGVEGVLIDENLSTAANLWAREHAATSARTSAPHSIAATEPDQVSDSNVAASQDIEPFDFLYRDQAPGIGEPNPWARSHAAAEWLVDATSEHFTSRDRSIQQWSSIGTGKNSLFDALTPLTAGGDHVPLEHDAVDSIDLIVILPLDADKVNQSSASPLNKIESRQFDDWPPGDSSTLVIDLCGCSVPESVAELGYRVITRDEVQAGMLGRCLNTLTHQSPPLDVLLEAIEEFSAI